MLSENGITLAQVILISRNSIKCLKNYTQMQVKIYPNFKFFRICSNS